MVNKTDLIEKGPIPIIGLLAGFAACTADIATFFFDNIRTRMQMNGTQGLPAYTSTMDCIKKTFKSHGV